VNQLMSDDAGEFGIALHEIEHARRHIDYASRQRKGVGYVFFYDPHFIRKVPLQGRHEALQDHGYARLKSWVSDPFPLLLYLSGYFLS